MKNSRAGFGSRASASRFRVCRRVFAGSVTAIVRKPAWHSTTWFARATVKAPIVIGRDHLDTGSVASPYRETEAMRDGSDAIADWPILNALLNTAAGAHWVSFHHGGGVGIGYSLHAGMVVVADGSDETRERLQCVLTTDPGMGVVRHADAGYELAIETADAQGIDWRLLIVRAKTIVTCDTDAPQSGIDFDTLGRIDDAALVLDDGRISAVGPSAVILSASNAGSRRTSDRVLDLRDCVVVPGIGRRARASALRRRSRAGLRRASAGEPPPLGMLYTVERTRAALLDPQTVLRTTVRPRLRTMFAHGTTTLETKTGYALHKPGEVGAARPDRAAS